MLGTLVLAVVAILVVVSVTLCAQGVIPPNRIIGIRTPPFRESARTWRIGHHAAIIPTAIAAAGCVIVFVVTDLDPATERTFLPLLISTGLLALGVVVGAVRGSWTIGHTTD